MSVSDDGRVLQSEGESESSGPRRGFISNGAQRHNLIAEGCSVSNKRAQNNMLR